MAPGKSDLLVVEKEKLYLERMVPLSHLNALRALEASVRHGSFTAAAAELGVTPAAIGQQVRKLEAALGQRLLVRRANGFEPTEIATSAATKLASGFDDLREALALMAHGNNPNRVFVIAEVDDNDVAAVEQWAASDRMQDVFTQVNAMSTRDLEMVWTDDKTPH